MRVIAGLAFGILAAIFLAAAVESRQLSCWTKDRDWFVPGVFVGLAIGSIALGHWIMTP